MGGLFSYQLSTSLNLMIKVVSEVLTSDASQNLQHIDFVSEGIRQTFF